MTMTKEQLQRRIAELESELDKARAKAALYDEIVANASDCLVGAVIGIEHEPNDLEPDEMFYFLRITEGEALRAEPREDVSSERNEGVNSERSEDVSMDETTAAIRKICENELLAAGSKVKFYRKLLGKVRCAHPRPSERSEGVSSASEGVSPVESNADCAEEVENLRSQLQEKIKELETLKRYIAQQKSENEVLVHKLRQACQERDKLAEKLRMAEEDDKKRSLLIETLNQLFEGESPRASEASFDEES